MFHARPDLMSRVAAVLAVALVSLVSAAPAGVAATENEDTLTARGLVVPAVETVLSAEIPGRIETVSVIEGQRVAAGAPIATLDCRTHSLRRDRHAADIRLAEKTLAVQRQLAGLNSGSALDRATAQARLDMARVESALTAAIIDRCAITAPFAGLVDAVKVDAHQYVTEGQPVAAVYDDSSLQVEVIVPSRWLAWLRPGLPFVLEVEELARAFPGTVARLGARIDPASQSLKIVGDLATPPSPDTGLLAGMSGQVRFSGP